MNKQPLRIRREEAIFCPVRKLLLNLFFLAILLMAIVESKAGAPGDSAYVTLHLKMAPIEKAFVAIKQQTPYRVIYDNSVLKSAKPVTVSVEKVQLPKVLNLLFLGQPFRYQMVDETIVIIPGKSIQIGNPISEIKASALVVADTLITGSVMAASSSLPLAGATISLKGSNLSTASDHAGRFQIRIPDAGATLIFSHVGYISKHVQVNKNSLLPVNIKLEKEQQEMDEVTVVSTGYQNIPKERATGSFTQIDNERFNEQTGTNILDRLPAIVNGMSVTNINRRNLITIRGLSAMSGPTGPLIIVDNFPYEGDLNNLNPNDVENISVLKDAAAASIWGSKAGNGVVVINMKKGNFNTPVKVEFNSNVFIGESPDLFAIKNFISSSDFIDVEEFLFDKKYRFSDTLYSDIPFSPVYEILFNKQKGRLSPEQAEGQLGVLRNVDVRKEYSKYFYQKAVNQQYYINVNGGRDNVAWNITGGLDKDVDELNSRFDRLNLKMDNRFKPLKNLEIRMGFYYTQSKLTSGKPAYGSIRNNFGPIPPYSQFADATGNRLPVIYAFRQGYIDTVGNGKLLDWNFYPLDNWRYVKTTNNLQDLIGNIGLNYSVNEELNIDIKYHYEKQQTTIRTLYDEQSYFTRSWINSFAQVDASTGAVTFKLPIGSILDLTQNELASHAVRAQINLHKSWTKNNISAIGGSEVRQVANQGNTYRTYGYNSNNLTFSPVDYINTYPTITGYTEQFPNNVNFTKTTNRFVSLYANGAYTFDNKYSVSASARKDASNLFGVKSNDKWNPLWSTGISWTVSNEEFYRMDILPYLKIRATYGFSGNVDPSRTAVTTLSYSSNSQYTQTPMTRIRGFFNPELSWEKVIMFNIGIDFKTRNNILYGSIEYFAKNAVDLYTSIPIDRTVGIGTGSVSKNAGELAGKGIDVELNSNNLNGAFKWVTNLNLNYYKDKLKVFYPGSLSGYGYVGGTGGAVIGKPLNSVFAYQWAGLDPQTGDPQGYINGEVSKNYSALILDSTFVSDLIYKGTAVPLLFGSIGNTFSWQNISLTTRIVYKLGYYFFRESINYGDLIYSAKGHSDFSQKWQIPGDELRTNVPSFIYPNHPDRDFFYLNSEPLVTKGDHIRLQYINLSYNIKSQRKKSFYQNMRLYFVCNNVGILWKANKEGIDPDYPKSQIPTSKNFTIGLNMAF